MTSKTNIIRELLAGSKLILTWLDNIEKCSDIMDEEDLFWSCQPRDADGQPLGSGRTEARLAIERAEAIMRHESKRPKASKPK